MNSPKKNQKISVVFDQTLPFQDPVVFASVETSPEALEGGSQFPITIEVDSVSLTGAVFKVTSNFSVNNNSPIKIHYFVVDRNNNQNKEIIDDNGQKNSYIIDNSGQITFQDQGNYVIDSLAVQVGVIENLTIVNGLTTEEKTGEKKLKDPVPSQCIPGSFSYTLNELNEGNPVDRSDYHSECDSGTVPNMIKPAGDLCSAPLEHNLQKSLDPVIETNIHQTSNDNYVSAQQCLDNTQCSNGCSAQNFGKDVCGTCGYDVSSLFPSWLRTLVDLSFLDFTYPRGASLTYSTVNIPYLGLRTSCYDTWFGEVCISLPAWKTYSLNVPTGFENYCVKWRASACTHQTSCIAYYYKPCDFSYICDIEKSLALSPALPFGSIIIATEVPVNSLYTIVGQSLQVHDGNLGHILLDPNNNQIKSGRVSYISAQNDIGRNFKLRLQAPQSSYISQKHGRGYKGDLIAQIEFKNANDRWEKYSDQLPEGIQWNLSISNCKSLVSGSSAQSKVTKETLSFNQSQLKYNIRTNSSIQQRDPLKCQWSLDASLTIGEETFDVFETAVVNKEVYFGVSPDSQDVFVN